MSPIAYDILMPYQLILLWTCGEWLVYPLWLDHPFTTQVLQFHSSFTCALQDWKSVGVHSSTQEQEGGFKFKDRKSYFKDRKFQGQKSYFRDGNSYMCIAHICAVAHNATTLELNEWCNFFPQHWVHLHVVSICARMSTDSWGITCSHPEQRIWVSVIGCVEKRNASSK